MKNLISRLKDQYAIPVIREKSTDLLERITLSLADGGLTVLEITLMSDDAYSVIEKLSKRSDLFIGAGTVLNEDQSRKAIEAGAKFLVSPGLNENAVKYARAKSVDFIPGVLTPSEIMQAQLLGCELVKVFPVFNVGGASYIKNLQGPFPTMKWMVTGGVDMKDYKSFMDIGCTCVGIGGSLIPQSLVKSQDWKALTQLAQENVEAVNSARK